MKDHWNNTYMDITIVELFVHYGSRIRWMVALTIQRFMGPPLMSTSRGTNALLEFVLALKSISSSTCMKFMPFVLSN